jgi:hypothetical protein
VFLAQSLLYRKVVKRGEGGKNLSHPQFQWARLDTAAKIFPCTSSTKDPKVFRFVCELKEPIVPQALQQALDQTIELFPGFQTILKRGMFWYYLEQTNMRPTAHEECRPPCSVLYDRDVHTLLFDVTLLWLPCEFRGFPCNFRRYRLYAFFAGIDFFAICSLCILKSWALCQSWIMTQARPKAWTTVFERYANRPEKAGKQRRYTVQAHLHGNKRTEGFKCCGGYSAGK